MKLAIQLMKRIFAMKFPWNLWVFVMALVNMVVGFLYFPTLEGKLILAALMASFIVMTIVFSKYGFVRLLGLGHVLFWTPLCLWLFMRLQGSHFDSSSDLKTWIYTLLAINTASLIIDYIDVIRYLKGDRAEV